MDYSRYVFSLTEKIQCLAVSLSATMLLAWLFYRSLWGMVLFPVILAVISRQMKREKLKKRKRQLLQEFKAAMQALAAALLAGYSMENAWRETEREMTGLYGKKALIVKELCRMNAAVRVNEPIEQALAEFAGRSGCEEIEDFAEIFLFAKRSGGDYVKIIRTTIQKMNGRMEVEQEIAAVLAGKRLEGRIMNGMPLLILAYMTVASGDFLDVLYGNALGVCIMTGVLAGYGAALRLSARVLEISL